MNAKLWFLATAAWLSVPASCVFGQPQAGTILWTYDLGSQADSSPSLAPDGTIYLGIDAGLCALTNGGTFATNKWTFTRYTKIGSTPAVASDGTIYFGCGMIFALNPDGSTKWSFSLSYALTPAGTKKWSYPIGSSDLASPVVGADGTVFIGNDYGSTIFAVGSDGGLKWSSMFHRNATGDSPAVGANEAVYVSAGPLYALDANGTTIWSIVTNDFTGASPTIGLDGTIYAEPFGSIGMCAIKLTGEQLWQVLYDPSCGIGGCPPRTTPAIDAAGTVYYCASNSIFALSPTGQIKWVITAPVIPPAGVHLARTSPVIGPEGTLYAALGTTLYAIATGTNGPANSPWPMYRQNARHTGKVEKPVLKQPQKRVDANFEFQLYPQQLGLTYTIDSSTNLNTWTSLTSFVATTFPTEVVDLTASNAPSRFYRASSPP